MKKTLLFSVTINILMVFSFETLALPTQVHSIISYESAFLDGVPDEIIDYIGEPDIGGCQFGEDDISEGAYNEDSNRNPLHPELDDISWRGWGTHFWKPTYGSNGGYLATVVVNGIPLYVNQEDPGAPQNAYQRAQNIYNEAINLYRCGQKFIAYHKLGMVSHLLEDMATPAHVNIDPHFSDLLDIGDDSYEKYIENIYDFSDGYCNPSIPDPGLTAGRMQFKNDFVSLSLQPINPTELDFGEPSQSLLFRLFYSMATKTAEWDSDDADGTGGTGKGGGSLRWYKAVDVDFINPDTIMVYEYYGTPMENKISPIATIGTTRVLLPLSLQGSSIKINMTALVSDINQLYDTKNMVHYDLLPTLNKDLQTK